MASHLDAIPKEQEVVFVLFFNVCVHDPYLLNGTPLEGEDQLHGVSSLHLSMVHLASTLLTDLSRQPQVISIIDESLVPE